MKAISKAKYIKAKKIVDEYLKQHSIPVKGDFYIFNGYWKSTKTYAPRFTIGKSYEILEIKHDYRGYDIAIALRDDNKAYRWYSLQLIIKSFTNNKRNDHGKRI